MVKSETDLNLRNSLNIFRIYGGCLTENAKRDREMIISGNSDVSPIFFDITISVFLSGCDESETGDLGRLDELH